MGIHTVNTLRYNVGQPSMRLRIPRRVSLLSGLFALSAFAAELRVEPGVVKPGDPLLVTVLGVAAAPEGSAGERELRFYEVPGGYQAITALPVEHPVGTLALRVEAKERPPAPPDDRVVQLGADGQTKRVLGRLRDVVLEGEVEVVDPKFRVRELQVASKYVKPPASVRKWIREDRAAFAKATSQRFTPPKFRGDFGWPRPREVTAPFGDLRTYNGKKQSQHYGVDLDGRTGDPIYAANDGKVVLVRECYASGNTVIVDHGAGLYTLYFHLSAFDVKQGAEVKRGTLLGKVGKTGRVTGPHLHWSVKADGLYVDGETLLTLPFRTWLGGEEG